MEVYYKVQNPKTGHMIDAYGITFNKLLTQGYTEEQLLKNKVGTSQKPKSPKVQQVYKEKQKYLESIMLPEEIIFEEIIMQMKESDFLSICQANKKFLKICDNENFWRKMYNKYYGDSGMSDVLPDLSWLELFKTCYHLTILQKTFNGGIALKDLYKSKDINIYGIVDRKLLKALGYMYHLKEINFHIADLSKPIIVPADVNALPFLTRITYNKI